MSLDDDLKGSASRLWKLIAERSRSKDRAAIEELDRRIWDLFGEEWAVMFTDLSGFSRRVAEFGIIHFLQVIHEKRRLLLPILAAHDGLLIKTEADSFLVLFKRVRAAVDCAIAMQDECRRYNRERKPEEQVLLCIGIGSGRVLRIGDDDVFGAEVNAASKLGEDLARSDEVLLTQAALTACGDLGAIKAEPLSDFVPGSERNYRLRFPDA